MAPFGKQGFGAELSSWGLLQKIGRTPISGHKQTHCDPQTFKCYAEFLSEIARLVLSRHPLVLTRAIAIRMAG